MDHVYAATVSISESRTAGHIGIALLCADCNGRNCMAQVQLSVGPMEVPATPMEWLISSLGALSDTIGELDWTFQHDADCEEAK